jgi:hypothetical protein
MVWFRAEFSIKAAAYLGRRIPSLNNYALRKWSENHSSVCGRVHLFYIFIIHTYFLGVHYRVAHTPRWCGFSFVFFYFVLFLGKNENAAQFG